MPESGLPSDKLNLTLLLLLLSDTHPGLLWMYTVYRSVSGVSAGPEHCGYTRDTRGHVEISMSS